MGCLISAPVPGGPDHLLSLPGLWPGTWVLTWGPPGYSQKRGEKHPGTWSQGLAQILGLPLSPCVTWGVVSQSLFSSLKSTACCLGAMRGSHMMNGLSVYNPLQRCALKHFILSELLLFISLLSPSLSHGISLGSELWIQWAEGPRGSAEHTPRCPAAPGDARIPPVCPAHPVITSTAIFLSVGWMLLGSV